MDLITKTKEIIVKHNLAEKLAFNPFKVRRESRGSDGIATINGFCDSPEFKDSYLKATNLQNKYQNRVVDGFYGFDVDCMPINWLEALEEFLAELEKDSPDFEIHIIKLKWGGARIYLGNESADAQKCVDILENTMQDNNLVY